MAGAIPLLKISRVSIRPLKTKVWGIAKRVFTGTAQGSGEEHHQGRQKQELCHSPAHTPYCLPPAKLLQRLSVKPNNTSEEEKKK